MALLAPSPVTCLYPDTVTYHIKVSFLWVFPMWLYNTTFTQFAVENSKPLSELEINTVDFVMANLSYLHDLTLKDFQVHNLLTAHFTGFKI